jgi:IS30 family transposase
MEGALERLILERLRLDWSPEQISERLKLEGICVSHETMYEYVKTDRLAGGSLYEHLRHGGRKYKKRYGKDAGAGRIPNRVDISERPAIVDEKSCIGDWESDTVVSTRSRAHLVTLVERSSKFLLVRKI